MKIQPFFDERTFTLSFVVYDDETKDAVIIDPVLDYDPRASKVWTESVDETIAFVQSNDLKLHWILETHAHADHLSGAQRIREQFPNAKTAIGERITEVQRMFRHILSLPPDFPDDGSQFDVLLKDGETYQAGSIRFNVVATPGHTPACTTLKFGNNIFTGDTLFHPDVGTGRCDFPGGSSRDLYRSVVHKLYAMPDDTVVWPGHDYPPSTRAVRFSAPLLEHKQSNVALPATRSEEDFTAWRNQRDRSLAAPQLLFQSIQVNVDAGHLPEPDENNVRLLRIPLNVFRPAKEATTEDLELVDAPKS